MQFFVNHSLLILLTLAGFFSLFWFFPFKKRLGMETSTIVIVTVILMIWGFIAAKWIFPFVEVFGDTGRMANLRLYGIIYFDAVGFFAVTKLFKTDRRLFFDVCSISMVVCAILGRLDCFVKGCCYGVPFFDTGFRWPIREIELVTNLLFIAFFIPRLLKEKTHGEVYPIYMIYYGVIRFFLECFRVEGVMVGVGAFHLAHIWSLISIFAGIAGLFIIYESNQRGKRRKVK